MRRVLKILKFVVVAALIITLLSFVVMRLADASAVWLARDHVLAGTGNSGPEQNSVRRIFAGDRAHTCTGAIA